MAYPKKYARQFDFQSYQNANPTRPLPGSSVNADLNAVVVSIDEVVEFFATFVRADGRLVNGSVGVDQMDPSFIVGFSLPTTWEPGLAYTVNSTVFHANKFWLCNTAHTSTMSFDEDKFDEIVDFGAQADAALEHAVASEASAAAALASETAAALSATSATSSASSATTSASTATTKAAEAEASAVAAAASAAAAATAETNAETAEANAETAEANAEIAQAAAEAAAAAIVYVTEDETYTVGSGQQYATLEAFLTAFSTWIVSDNALVTASIVSGTLSSTKQNVINQPFAHRLKIAGAALTSIGSPTAVSIAGSTGAWDVTFTKASHGLSVGEYVRIKSLAGTGAFRTLNGFFKVTAVPDANSFTVRNNSPQTSITATVTSGTVDRMNTLLDYTGSNIRDTARNIHSVDPGALEIISRGVQLENIGIITSDAADSDAQGIMLRHHALAYAVANVCINGFPKNGVWCLYNSTFVQSGIVVSNIGAGGQAIVGHFGGVVTGSDAIITGCAGSGARARDGGFVTLPSLISCGNLSGVSSEGNGVMSVGSSFLDYNTTDGAIPDTFSYVDLSGAQANNNGAYGLDGEDGGEVNIASFTATNNGTASARLVNCNTTGTPSSMTGAAISKEPVTGVSASSLANFLTTSAAINFGSIAAQGELTSNVTLAGVEASSAKWVAMVANNGTTPAGIIFDCQVSAADTVTVRARNITAGAVDPANQTFRIIAFKVA